MPRSFDSAQYWDACIFISWLQDENRVVNEREALRVLVAQALTGRIHIVTSKLTLLEVLEGDMTDIAKGTFKRFLRRRNVTLVETSEGVWKKAREIRNWSQQQRNLCGTRLLAVPDSIHLASAIVYNCSVFFTYDLQLLRLSGTVAGYPLLICKPPEPSQSVLDFPRNP